MNINAGQITVHLVEVDGVLVARAEVFVYGDRSARFEVPLDPALRDIRDDVATLTARAADTMLALVRELPAPNEMTPDQMALVLTKLSKLTTNDVVGHIHVFELSTYQDDFCGYCGRHRDHATHNYPFEPLETPPP